MTSNPFVSLIAKKTKPQTLIPQGSWGAARHLWDEKEFDALALALGSGRPLLLRGEPGTGKSQVARAAAALLKWEFRYEVITARHEAQDLLWRYDAVERLAKANKGDTTHMRDYVTPGVLWWGLNPASAALQAKAVQASGETPNSPKGTVVLLDEIDKADSDLPNSLLEVLANGSFTLPWGVPLRDNTQAPHPTLVIITSNEERELPAAFVRRCICLHLVPPPDSQQAKFCEWLQERAKAQFDNMTDPILQQAASLVYADRIACPPGMGARPGLAEYLDLLRAVQQIAPNDQALQKRWLDRLAPYALLKQYPQEQKREPPVSDPRLPAGS